MVRFDPLGNNIPQDTRTHGWGFHQMKSKSRKISSYQSIHYFPVDGDGDTLCERIFKTITEAEIIYLDTKEIKKLKLERKLCNECVRYLPPLINGTFRAKSLSRKSIQDLDKTIQMNTLNDDYVCIPKGVRCSEPGCKATGGTFIKKSESIADQPHYCSEHNLKIKIKTRRNKK